VPREEDHPPHVPPEFPERQRPLVARCLRLDPTDRYADMGDLLHELGQTARQGDSVRFDWSTPDSSPLHAFTAGTDAGGATLESPRTPPRTSAAMAEGGVARTGAMSELKQTAADLTRGAVQVARGMWDGLRQSTTTSETVEAQTEMTAEDAALEIPSSWRDPLLDEPDEPEEPEEPEESALRSGARNTHRLRDEARLRARELIAAVRGRREFEADARGTALAESRRPAATVPVPPRAEGGVLGIIVSTGVVAVEVLAALVGGLARGAWRTFLRWGHSLLRASGGFGSRVGRLALFMLGMALLGALVMGLGLVFVEIAS
jgi:hypothetical protein